MINLEQVCMHTDMRTCRLAHINIANLLLHTHCGNQLASLTQGIAAKMYIQMGGDGEVANGRPHASGSYELLLLF